MRIKYIFCVVMLFWAISGNAQLAKGPIEKAYLNGDTLKILFTNKSSKTIIVPVLSYRIGIDKRTLYDKFYHYNNDTLFIALKKEINRDLYKINSSHKSPTTEGKLFYVDKTLRPRKKYWSSVRINKPGTPKILVLQFENDVWITRLDP